MPLIGAQGPGSQIAWRGNLDEYPDEFQFPAVVEVQPGSSGISTEVIITGINYKALVTVVGSAASVSVTPYQEETDDYGAEGDFLPGNDSNNQVIIRNKDKLKLKIDTEGPFVKTDYARLYTTNIKIGKRPESVWSVTTKLVDNDPDPFSFDSKTGLEVHDNVASDNVTITGIDETVGADVFMLSRTGEVRINGGSPTRSGKIFPGQGLYIVDRTSTFYSTDVETSVQVGTYATTFTHSTRAADTTIDPFTLPTILNSDTELSQEASPITISGADPSINDNNPLPISISSGGQYKVTRSGTIVQQFTDSPGTVENGDVITVRLTSSSEFSTEVNTTLTVSNESSTYRITTRPRPIDTIPDQFAFNNLIDQDRGVIVTSNEVTLAGMTAFGDEGTASISGTNAEFKVVRDDVIVRDYSSNSFGVQLGDKITLRLTTSPNSLGDVSATFTVAGTDTTDVLSGINGSTTSTWNVTSALRSCTIDAFTLTNLTGDSGGLQPGEMAETSFISSGFDSDCGIIATTSDPNSYLKIGSREGVSLDNINIGDTIEVYMSTPYYDQTRTTTVTLTSSYGTSQSADWTIGPISPPLPELDLDANDRNVPFVFPDGGTAVLTYTYNYVTNVNAITNFGVTTIPINTLSSGTQSGTTTQINLPAGTTNFSMTVSNSTGSTSDNVDIIVGSPPNPTITLCPSDTSSCSDKSTNNKGGSVRLYWKTTNAVRTESPDFSTKGKQNGNILISNLTEDDKTFSITAIGAGNPAPTTTATHTVNLRPFVDINVNKNSIVLGENITLSWTSEFATEVANSSGFSTRDLSGSLVVTPTSKGNFTFGITVRDEDGLQSSDSVSIDVIEDRSPFAFKLSPDNFDNLNLGQRVETQPIFTEGDPQSLGGLSPGVSLVARLSGQGNPKFFKNNSTTLTVQNGTPASDLKFYLNASNDYNIEHTASLAIGDKSDSVSASTDKCIVQNSTSNLDGMTFNMRQCISRDGRNQVLFNDIAFLSIEKGGTEFIDRIGDGIPAYEEFECEDNKTTSYTWTAPSGINGVTLQGVGGGGAGSSYTKTTNRGGHGGGGGGAAEVKSTTSAGTKFNIVVGNGGRGEGQNGNLTSINAGEITFTNVIYVSVIDETSRTQSEITSDWLTFKRKYPNRRFYLLYPKNGNQSGISRLKVPSEYQSDPFATNPITVNRDEGKDSNASDWFDLMDFDRFGEGDIVSLSIDNSGSMRRSTVQASIDLFSKKCEDNKITVSEVSMGTREKWAVGHINVDVTENVASFTDPYLIARGGTAAVSRYTKAGIGGGFEGTKNGLKGSSGRNGSLAKKGRRGGRGSNIKFNSEEGGSGGGSGRPQGGQCKDGSDCGQKGGGAGAGQGSNPSGKCTGDNCRSGNANGADGKGYGSGGGGGSLLTSKEGRGGFGGNGIAKISWTIKYPQYTKAQVVHTIRNVYWDDSRRPPTYNEIKNYYDLFKTRPDLTGLTLGEFEVYMKKGVANSADDVVSVDNCGNIFPLYRTERVEFNVTRSASWTNTITFELVDGFGPPTLTFGPNSRKLTFNIMQGATYKLKDISIRSGTRGGGKLRISGSVLELEDNTDNDYNDLRINPSKGRFTDTQTYQL